MTSDPTSRAASARDLRHPKPGVIDHRQQRIDPANRHSFDPNEPADHSQKQPGGKPASLDDPGKQSDLCTAQVFCSRHPISP